MSELFEALLIAAARKAREDAYAKHGPFMPSVDFHMVELCNQLITDAGYYELLS